MTGAKDLFDQKFSFKEKIFRPENALEDKTESHVTDRYRLLITPFKTGKNTWWYTQGRVFRIDTGELIAEVRRNYSSFPFAWVENHDNGHDYLICGEDYQGQTILELDTGKRSDYLPEEARKGFGWCCSGFHPSPSGRYLAVSGCIWAGPYEVKIFDVSNPIQFPWPILYESDYSSDSIVWGQDGGEFAMLGNEREFCDFVGKDEYECEIKDFEKIEAEAKRLGIDEDDLWEDKFVQTGVWRPSPIISSESTQENK
jgi:hypothetical protein